MLFDFYWFEFAVLTVFAVIDVLFIVVVCGCLWWAYWCWIVN